MRHNLWRAGYYYFHKLINNNNAFDFVHSIVFFFFDFLLSDTNNQIKWKQIVSYKFHKIKSKYANGTIFNDFPSTK